MNMTCSKGFRFTSSFQLSRFDGALMPSGKRSIIKGSESSRLLEVPAC
jgi:hypothetical protein